MISAFSSGSFSGLDSSSGTCAAMFVTRSISSKVVMPRSTFKIPSSPIVSMPFARISLKRLLVEAPDNIRSLSLSVFSNISAIATWPR